MEEARGEEKSAVLKNDPSKTFLHSIYGWLVLLIVAVDMGWNKHSSGRRYDSTSGIAHMIGVLFQKS